MENGLFLQKTHTQTLSRVQGTPTEGEERLEKPNIIETEKHVGWCAQMLKNQNKSKQRKTFTNQEFYFQQTCP